MQTQLELTQQFRQLNQQGKFLLPNAWDCASARIFAAEGFPAIGTTSAGIAYARGFRDAELIGRDAMLREVGTIAACVKVPVNADIEAGYGAAPAEVAQTVRATIAAGAVGVNLEDRVHGEVTARLFASDEQVARIAAARAAASQAGLPLWINARTDTFLLGLGVDAEDRFAQTVARANAYFAAGADMVFVPGLADLDAIRRLCAALQGPVNLMAMPGAPSAPELFAAGARRVSLGLCPMLAVMGLVRDIAQEAKAGGTWQHMTRSFYGFAEAEALFSAE
ncbi:isocitrate lyase/PEP mutase family protein [Roseateles oligotrophus]|uniref:Isocitrate lyase/phosphoenolpyruvate mutase family protein n=1 Tax=Roseateles oligotrophus TaxID=1769250 RepID=A0ABT2YGG3_9BURK|nr:isocitrate lyase/phosphoenolpyruvate mutase family protein [Roseateles oligotrophus]MCV2369142.1 isocitrate lyase/phosphoenolpyruvate mutase family protein [Roseateles oligotrophus]